MTKFSINPVLVLDAGSHVIQESEIAIDCRMAIEVESLVSSSSTGGARHAQKRPRLLESDAKAEAGSPGPGANAFGSADLLKSQAALLKSQHDHASPYRHAVLKDIFDSRLLRLARDEIRNALAFTLKETDIYKVFQTGDLANLDGLSEEESQKLKSLQTVRDSLYSQEFRDFLHQVTSCGPLSGKQTDMSINDYRHGCHLLNHDDVIGTRRVSYILYLTDPETPWEAEDGGALELYPVDKDTHQPLPNPTCKILPHWNQFVFFVVQPGKSFHSVEEVFNLKKSRLSISGWFHLPHEDEIGYLEGRQIKEDEEKQLQSLGASLDQLKGKSDDHSDWVDIPAPIHEDLISPLSPDDLKYLSQFIEPSFLKHEDVSKLRDRFVRDSHLSLMGFLSYSFSVQLKQAILMDEAADLLTLSGNRTVTKLYTEDYLGPRFELGLQNETWALVGPPHKHRYLTPSEHDQTDVNAAKSKLTALKRLFESSPFLRWLHLITTCIPTSQHIVPRRFRPGLDYTLATSNDSQLLELNLSLTPSLGWDDGELGGWDCYMASSEEDQSDPAIYKAPVLSKDGEAEDDSALLTIYPSWNRLELVLRDPQILTFTKYVSFKSPYSKWDIKAAYKILETDDDES